MDTSGTLLGIHAETIAIGTGRNVLVQLTEARLLVGVMSDSHGRVLAVRKALELFDRHGVSHVIHCGDIGGMEVFDEFIGRRLTFVWGNTDVPDDGLIAYLQSVGLVLPEAVPTTIEFDGIRFAVFHGHEREFEQFRGFDAEFVLHGHTHVPRDEPVGVMRVVNPGALHRAAKKTVATIDTATGQVDFHHIVCI